jgi:hypothetical protein
LEKNEKRKFSAMNLNEKRISLGYFLSQKSSFRSPPEKASNLDISAITNESLKNLFFDGSNSVIRKKNRKFFRSGKRKLSALRKSLLSKNELKHMF